MGGSWKFLRSDLQLRPEHKCDAQEDSLEEAAQSRTGRLLQSGGPVLLCRGAHHGAVYTEVHLSEMKLQPSLSAHQPHLRRQWLHITGGAVLDTPSITGSSVFEHRTRGETGPGSWRGAAVRLCRASGPGCWDFFQECQSATLYGEGGRANRVSDGRCWRLRLRRREDGG